MCKEGEETRSFCCQRFLFRYSITVRFIMLFPFDNPDDYDDGVKEAINREELLRLTFHVGPNDRDFYTSSRSLDENQAPLDHPHQRATAWILRMTNLRTRRFGCSATD